MDRDRRLVVWSLATGDPVGAADLQDAGLHVARVGDMLGVQDTAGRGYVFRLPGMERVWAELTAGTAGIAVAGDDLLFLSDVGRWIRVSTVGAVPTVVSRGDWRRRLLSVWQGGARPIIAEPWGILGILDVPEMKTTPLPGHAGDVAEVVWSGDGALMMSAAAEEAIIWEASGGRRRVVLEGHVGPIKAARWSPDTRQMATASLDGTVRIVRWLTEGQAWMERGSPVSGVVYAEDGTGWSWCAESGFCAAVLDGQRVEVPFQSRPLGVHAGHAVSRTREATPWVTDPSGEVLETEAPLAFRTCAGAGSPLRVAGGTPDGDVHVWTQTSVGIGHSAFETRSDVRYVRLSLDNDRVAELSGGHVGTLWELSTGTFVAPIPKPLAALSPDQIKLAERTGELIVASSIGGASRFSVVDGSELPAVAEGTARWITMDVSADGTLIGAGGHDRTVHLYALPSGERLLSAGPFPGLPTHIALSPGGRWLAAYDDQGDLRVWDVEARRLVRHVHAGIGPSPSLGFQGEDRVVAGRASGLGIWALGEPPPDPTTLTNLRVCRGEARAVPVVPFPTDPSPWAPEPACGAGR
jgi:WD40 repeat protein